MRSNQINVDLSNLAINNRCKSHVFDFQRRVANLSVTAMEKVNNRTFYLGSPAEILCEFHVSQTLSPV